MSEYVIGVDIGGTKIAAFSSDRDYNTLSEVILPCPSHQGGQVIMQTVIACCQQLQQQTKGILKSVGVGTAGQINPHTGMVIAANDNLPDWIGTPIAAILHDALGVPVAVDNDVKTMALAEATLGAGKSYRHLLCLTVGTGIGGAIILNGALWHGVHFNAGEIGYIQAKAGYTLEELMAGPALEKLYQKLTHSEIKRSLKEILTLVDNDPIAREVIAEHGASRLGEAIAPILFFIDPEALIVGGGVPEIGDLWWQPFVTSLQSFSMRRIQDIHIHKAELGNRAGRIGAAILAWQKVDKS